MSYIMLLTWGHTIISLIALFLGIPVIAAMLGGRVSNPWTKWFLIFAIACTVTGFMFPFGGVTPAFATGLVASAVFAVVLVAAYVFHYTGHWRWLYAGGVVISVYLLAFVGVVQAFLKVPFVNALAPTQTELPFLVAQIGVLVAFVVLGILSAIKFKGAIARGSLSPPSS